MMQCPRCMQDEVHETRIAVLDRIVFLCPECDATWLSADAVGVEPFVSFGPWLETQGITGAWPKVEWLGGRLSDEQAKLSAELEAIRSMLSLEWQAEGAMPAERLDAGVDRIHRFLSRKPRPGVLAGYLEVLGEKGVAPPISRDRAEYVARRLLLLNAD